MPTYTIETHGGCPQWSIKATHPSNQFAIDYWHKLFANSPESFPANCWWLAIFNTSNDDQHLVAEIILTKSPRAVNIHNHTSPREPKKP